MNVAWPARTADWDDEVARFLRANPDWLACHPELYRSLTPPRRVHGEPLADHMAAMVLRERQHAGAMEEQTAAVLAAGRAATAMLARVHEAVITLIAADDVAECLATELPSILGLDASCLCRYSGGTLADQNASRLDGMLGSRDVLFRMKPADASVLYREAAGLAWYDALIRLPTIGVLGLASRHSLGSEMRSAQLGLKFLGKTVAAILGRPTDNPAEQRPR